MPRSTDFSDALHALILQGDDSHEVCQTLNIKANSGAPNVYVSLHDRPLAEDEDQDAAEISSPMYERFAALRDVDSWLLLDGSARNLIDIGFRGDMTVHPTARAFAIGIAPTGSGRVIWNGTNGTRFSSPVVSMGGLDLTAPAHGLSVDDPVVFLEYEDGDLPTEISTSAVYYVVSVPTVDSFEVSATVGGAAITLSKGGGYYQPIVETVLDEGGASYDELGLVIDEEGVPPANPQPPPGGELLQTISAFGITMTFDQEYICGEYIRKGSGLWWVYSPTGVILIDKTPRYRNGGTVTVNGVTTTWHGHGTMRSMSCRFVTQGLDSTIYMHFQGFQAYTHAASPTSPGEIGHFLTGALPGVAVPAGDTIIGCISKPTPGNRPQLSSIMYATIVDTIPPDGAFRPTYARTPNESPWFGVRPAETRTIHDIDYSRIPSLPITSELAAFAAPWAQLAGLFDGCWFDHARDFLKRYHRPSLHQLDYGRDICAMIEAALGQIMLAYPQGDKEETIQGLVQIGLDWYWLSRFDRWGALGSTVGPSNIIGHFNMDAGQTAYENVVILFAGLLLHDQDMIDEVLLPSVADLYAGTIGAVKQYWGMHDQYCYVGDEVVPFTQPVCGYGATPLGGANWTPNGTPEWRIQGHQDVVYYGYPKADSAWYPVDQANFSAIPAAAQSLYPRSSSGAICPKLGSVYRLGHTTATSHVHNTLLREWDRMGLINAEDFVSRAYFEYFGTAAQPVGRYHQASVDNGFISTPFQITPGPFGGAIVFYSTGPLTAGNKFVRAHWLEYGLDYTTRPNP